MDFLTSPTVLSPRAKEEAASKPEDQAGLVPSHGISLQTGSQRTESGRRPPPVKHVSVPAYDSPLRHHQRGHPREVKESLNARSEYVTSQDDGSAQHRINQYLIKQEIGRGSFGAVHLAVDQFGTEYAVKEFSKSRLRKRAQSHILRKPRRQPKHGHLAGPGDFNSPLHRIPSGDPAKAENSIDLIKEEIAIMKKLNHPNLCGLMEVLDDPREDSLYMVMEMCKKGIIMKVGLDQRSDPYDDDRCRRWFRDLILGIEYLHAQGIVHRDIKPDNCLLTEQDVLKVVDFGVSEMFEKDSEMMIAKSTGSPAFLPPELCVVKHGDISGKSADIWSMGVTLFCLKYGHIPFEKSGIFELYEAIKSQDVNLETEQDQDFRDLMGQLLEKDPSKRIKMSALREHAWVTKHGTDPLLSEAENTAKLIGPPTDAEMESAITGNVANLLTVMKAVNKFKRLVVNKRPAVMSSILGEDESSRFSQPPLVMPKGPESPVLPHKSRSLAWFDRRKIETALAVEGVHRELNILSESEDDEQYLAFRPNQAPHQEHGRSYDEIGHRGHAHDPLEDHLYLYIGPSTFSGASGSADRRATFAVDGEEGEAPIVSESPGAADLDIYETAYRDEIERIIQRSKAEGKEEEEPTVYLTRRVDAKLLAVGQLAGRFMAKGEEGFDRFGTATGWKDKRARVTDVSRILRTAAREEYEKRRQERRQKGRGSGTSQGSSTIPPARQPDGVPEGDPESQREGRTGSGEKWSENGGEGQQSWTSSILNPTFLPGRAIDRGKQAKESFKSLLGMKRGGGSLSPQRLDTPPAKVESASETAG